MDLNGLWMVSFNWDFILSFLSIVLIDIVLAGDNAVVIAMAVKSLSPKQRSRGIMIGAAGAVVIRIILTFFAAKLLSVSFVKLFGGILIAWIAVKLFLDGAPEDKFRKEVKTLGQAVVTIMIADLVMSTDNILAVAGASKGKPFSPAFRVRAEHTLRRFCQQPSFEADGQVLSHHLRGSRHSRKSGRRNDHD